MSLVRPDSNKNKGHTERVEAQARSWAVYLHSGDATADKLAEFEAWLAADADHAIAYHDYEQIMMDLGMPCGAPEGAQSGPSEPAFLTDSAPKRSSFTFRSLTGGVMAAAFALAATVGVSLYERPVPDAGFQTVDLPAIETRIAEIRDVELPDGTVVTLGAKSRIDYKFEDGLRTVVLEEGEAYFDVAPDKAHPFYVQAGDRLIRVVGTQFDVRQSSASVMVAVVEGVVEVMKAQDPEATEKRHDTVAKDVLTAGDKVTATIGETQRLIETIDPEKAASWRTGWLAYEDVSLDDIIADLHRYDDRNFVFSDAELRHVRVTAAFGAEDVDQFLYALEASYPLSVDRSDPSKVIFLPAS
ncbi:FecR family protein [Hyphomonas adhaerens]|uniref:Iron dicitrate transport regulator FecR n=1 Tax=Hyphomonas adhaerens TaxID=81029 RepID=A0A3B9GYZ0_9PROT|nr:FecR domain-containing protein [Hyphomonas adhaerens]MBB41964.1 hypothetical protein [Hyphomonas sp.]HAE27650.1 hypothetical protein [Hyphomonas adhaerens]